MNKKLLHTPDGVRDIYGDECYKKMELQKNIHTVLSQYGYQSIQTPAFEFFDIFNQERGSVHAREMYKFFDRENNTLVLRPDITPSIARCVAKYYETEEMPLRLCYLGNTFLNNSNYQGKLKEVTQIGAELILDDSFDADAEMIAMAVDSCLAAGLKEFQIEIGQVEFFKGILADCNLDSETEEQIRSFIENKNFLGLENQLSQLEIDAKSKEILMKFDHLYGGAEVLEEALELTTSERAQNAIKRLKKVQQALVVYGVEPYISYDLGMLNLYNYYTGITFRGYTYGTGDAIVKGGRYNNLISQFGKNAPSVGFGFRVDELLVALERQGMDPKIPRDQILILYDKTHLELAIKVARDLRKQGKKAELLRFWEQEKQEEYIRYSQRQNVGKLILLCDKLAKGQEKFLEELGSIELVFVGTTEWDALFRKDQ